MFFFAAAAAESRRLTRTLALSARPKARTDPLGRGVGRNRVTLQTIADRLGVSRTTVSNAYNRPDQLAPELRERILATAAELGYSGPGPGGPPPALGRAQRDRPDVTRTSPTRSPIPPPCSSCRAWRRRPPPRGSRCSSCPPGAEVGGVEMVRDAVVDAFVLYSMPHSLETSTPPRAGGLPVVVVDEPAGGAAPRSSASTTAPACAPSPSTSSASATGGSSSSRTASATTTTPAAWTPSAAAAPSFALARAAPRRARRRVRGAPASRGTRCRSTSTREHDCRAGRSSGASCSPSIPARPPWSCTTDLLAIGVMRAAREQGLDVPGTSR